MKTQAKELLADALLYTVLLAAGGFAGIFYESRNAAVAAQQELQDLQRRTAITTAWLRGERTASETRMQAQISALQSQLSQEQGQANEKHHTHVAGVRAGTVSVRVPIVPASCQSSGLPGAGVSSAEPAAAHAQLDPAAAADLATITHEGDASIRDLNYCIAQYNAVKDAHDAWRLKLEGMAHAQTP